MVKVNREFIFSSESVTEGHPDKVADQIVDAILDNIIAKDPECRVAAECFIKTGFVVIGGEISTKVYCDIPRVARETIKKIGYNDSDPYIGFNGDTCGVLTSIDEQSADIACGVNKEDPMEQGAGDQGIMFGYACKQVNEELLPYLEEDYMPLPIVFAHMLTKRLAESRKNNELDFLRPDGKSQVTVMYDEHGVPKRITTVVVSTHHKPDVERKRLVEAIEEEIINKVLPPSLMNPRPQILINPTGRFVIGGPRADSGLSGRKLIVDTYGGWSRFGGGAFSGKDPSKVDRSGTYMARYAAKNIVAAGLADEIEIQVAYAIGEPRPVSIFFETFGTEKKDSYLKAIDEILHDPDFFDFRPRAIIEKLDLLKPRYSATACYGHFGRREDSFTWERLDMVEKIKEKCVD